MRRNRWQFPLRSVVVTTALVAVVGFASSASARRRPPAVDQGSEKPEAGFVFLGGTTGKPEVREKPAADAKVLTTLPAGGRVVYRSVFEIGGKITWYKIEPLGAAPGWIAVESVSTTRPSPLPASKPMKLVEMDDAHRAASGAAASTAAVRGLDGRAGSYAASSDDLKEAAPKFVTLEHNVDQQFASDEYNDVAHEKKNDFPDTDNPTRREHAKSTRAGIK